MIRLTARIKPPRVYTIPVDWIVANDIVVEARSLDEAISIAEDADLPYEGAEYVDGSFRVNYECAREINEEIDDEE